MVGTKVDLRDAELAKPSGGSLTPITKDQTEKVRADIHSQKCMEVSAKAGTNIKEVFEEAVKIVLAVRKAADPDAHGDDPTPGGDQMTLVKPAVQPKKGKGCVIF